MTILIFDINLENVSRHVHSSFALAVLRSGRSPDPRLRGTRGGAGAVRSALILTQGRPQEGFALRRLPVDDGPQILYHLHPGDDRLFGISIQTMILYRRYDGYPLTLLFSMLCSGRPVLLVACY